MTPDRIESLLRTEGIADEAAFRARPLPATVGGARARLGDGRTATGLQRFAMAAVAAVAVLAVSVLATTWFSTLPEQPSIGASDSAAASPTPANTPPATEGDGRCTAADFAITSDPWDAGAGARGTRSLFRVVDSVGECTLPATISARITDASGNVLVEGTSDPEAAAPVAGGDQLNLEISWSNWCGPDPERPLHLEVMVASDDTAVPVEPPAGSEILVPPCLGSGQPSVLNVVGLQH
jgi:hypothetical protein